VAVLDLRITDVENLKMPALPAEIKLEGNRAPEYGIVNTGIWNLKVRRTDRHAGHRHDQFLPVRMAEPAGVAQVKQVFHHDQV
jgi:hypothetical protein